MSGQTSTVTKVITNDGLLAAFGYDFSASIQNMCFLATGASTATTIDFVASGAAQTFGWVCISIGP